jgi:hypothetical protein
VIPVASDGETDEVAHSELSMAEFNDLLNFEGDHASPTTSALIVHDDNDLLIFGKRRKNTNSEQIVRGYRVVGHEVVFNVGTVDRAGLAAILVEEFGGDALTTDERYARTKPVTHGVPTAVAVDGKPAVAAWLTARHGASREQLANQMDVTEASVSEYLSRFRRRGTGIPDDVNPPAVGDKVPAVPEAFRPQQIVAVGGDHVAE